MRVFVLILTIAFTVALCIILDSRLVLPAPLGKLLSPQHGIWQNAEHVDTDFSADLKFSNLKAEADVYFDERLVPHIFAKNESDAYFIQGYLHAKFRLFQMELQTLAAAGRASELVGEVAVNHDREFRRLGMVYGAESSLRAMESDPDVKAACDAYTAGVNSYIAQLTAASLPLEYKLLGHTPEKWSNMKSALFLKYMSQTLAGYEEDFERTNARDFFSPEDFKMLFPAKADSVDPVIPAGAAYPKPQFDLTPNVNYDTFGKPRIDSITPAEKPDPGNGSNNWAVAGTKTSSGSPILCNDPHLKLNLPSLWYEMQISVPGHNVYGASFPGAPSVIIGFNDSIAWGVTNGGRDVRDYYEIKFKDESRNEYWFDSSWHKTSIRYESIKVKGKPDQMDTVVYTLFGPVMYDNRFGEKSSSGNYAVNWTAHRAGKELLTFMLLNKARNYNDFNTAIANMHTPGQNFVFASRSGDIALRTQGEWPAKWKGQGDFIMPGFDSSYLWKGFIPSEETPFQLNPERGFVSSANQLPADSSYPYYMGTHYGLTRGKIINRMLSGMSNISVQDMMRMQTDNYNIFGEWAAPLLIKNIREYDLNTSQKEYLSVLTTWDNRNDTGSVGATVFKLLWDSLHALMYRDEYVTAPPNTLYPSATTLLESLLKDSSYRFTDNILTDSVETVSHIVTQAFINATIELDALKKTDRLSWVKYKDTRVRHLLMLDPLSRLHLPIGGGEHVINTTKEQHGPSWRMIVHLDGKGEAYGIYPGGQSGNPGSRFYDNFIDKWAAGQYYSLWLMKQSEGSDARVKWRMKFSRA